TPSPCPHREHGNARDRANGGRALRDPGANGWPRELECAALDHERHRSLHTIIMLRDVIRKWWRAELSFADDNGQVKEWVSGEIVPPSNDFCRLSLFSKEGLRRCSQSVKVLHDKFITSPKLRHAVFHDCHLNFSILGVPLYLNGRY